MLDKSQILWLTYFIIQQLYFMIQRESLACNLGSCVLNGFRGFGTRPATD